MRMVDERFTYEIDGYYRRRMDDEWSMIRRTSVMMVKVDQRRLRTAGEWLMKPYSSIMANQRLLNESG